VGKIPFWILHVKRNQNGGKAMNCPYCGIEYEDYEKVCPLCGTTNVE